MAPTFYRLFYVLLVAGSFISMEKGSLALTPNPRKGSTVIKVLTYNIKAMYWPISRKNKARMKKIGKLLKQRRNGGTAPDVVLIQEGFNQRVIPYLFNKSNYSHVIHGPSKYLKPLKRDKDPRLEQPVRSISSGLHVLTDHKVKDQSQLAYGVCKGFDCLANKGIMHTRIKIDSIPFPIDVLNTHMNAGATLKKNQHLAELARHLQVDTAARKVASVREKNDFRALIFGGDFNLKPKKRKNYPYLIKQTGLKDMGRVCLNASETCKIPLDTAIEDVHENTVDRQLSESKNAIQITPLQIETVFEGKKAGGLAIKRPLSDHLGYEVTYRIEWNFPRVRRELVQYPFSFEPSRRQHPQILALPEDNGQIQP